MKYHISPKTGEPKPCKASIKDCPVGGKHYENEDEARKGYEKDQKNSVIPTVLTKKVANTEPKIVKVKYEKVSPNKTWKVTTETSSKMTLVEVKKIDGEYVEGKEIVTVPKDSTREIKQRNRVSQKNKNKTVEVNKTVSEPSIVDEVESLSIVDHDWGEPDVDEFTEESIDSFDDLDSSQDYEDGCEECGDTSMKVKWREDPYELAAYGESNYRNLCDDCYVDRASF